MKILCIYFNSSNRIQQFINYFEKNYDNIILDKYNLFNKNDFKILEKNKFNHYDGIFLLGTGPEKKGSQKKNINYRDIENYSNIQSKISVNYLLKKNSKILDCINTIIYNNIKTPIIGICYGAQILNSIYKGDLYSNSYRIQGFFETELDTSNKLFKNLNKNIYPQYNHYFSYINNYSKPIAINKNNNVISGYQHSKYHYSLSFHLIKSDKSSHKIIDNFINIVKDNSKKMNTLYLFFITIFFLLLIFYFNKYYKNKYKNVIFFINIFLILIYFSIIAIYNIF